MYCDVGVILTCILFISKYNPFVINYDNLLFSTHIIINYLIKLAFFSKLRQVNVKAVCFYILVTLQKKFCCDQNINYSITCFETKIRKLYEIF